MGEQNGFDVLAQKRQKAFMGGGKEKQDDQHAESKLTARERISRLLDEESFVETEAFLSGPNGAPGEGVVTGYGTIDGRGVYVVSQDFTVLGGSLGAAHARKICKTLELAGKTGLPVIMMLDSMGARIGEGIGTLEGFGSVIGKLAQLSGIVPVISIICGQCAGTAAFFAPLSDFVLIAQHIGGIFTAAPGAFNRIGEEPDPDGVGGAAAHAKAGIAHFNCASEDGAFYSVRQLLSYLPDNNIADAEDMDCADDLNRMIENYTGEFDARQMVRSVMDGGIFLETQEEYAKDLVTGFARINGRSIGVVASTGKELDAEACDKAAGIVSFCDAFGIPVITFADTPGFAKDKNQGALLRSGARLMSAYAEATVPMITVITGKAVGAGYVAMAPKALGADMVFAWPDAQISCLPADASAVIMMGDTITDAKDPVEARQSATEAYAQTQAAPWEAAELGFVDEVIYPSETRQRIAGALELAIGKRETRLPKKHGSR